MKLGEKYSRNKKDYSITRIDKSENAIFVTLTSDNGNHITVGSKVLEDTFKKEEDKK